MARYQTSVSRLAYQLFVIVCLLLLLALCWYCYVRYNAAVRENNYYHTDTFYKTVQDSIRRTQPATPRVRVVYVPAPTDQAALAALQATVAQLREDMRRDRAATNRLLAVRPSSTVVKPTTTVALNDTTVRRRTETGRVVVTKAKTGTFRDPWLNLTGVVIPGQNGRPDSLQARYMIRNDFDVQVYSKRTGKWWQWWKGRQAYVDLKNKNPNATTTKMEHLKVEKK
jgi:hypothetical protein